MAVQIGTAHIHGITGGTIAHVSGYVSPNIQSLKVAHQSDKDAIKGMNGNTTGLIFQDEGIEVTFEFIPEGSSIANAKLAATLPAPGAGVTITGLPVIPIGIFADGLNAATWIYEGGGSINGQAAGKWTSTLPLRRYVGITSVTPM